MNFNEWRQRYDQMTFEQQQDYHDYLEGLYPDQAHYNLEAAKKVFDWLKPHSVIEAGTWKAYELCPAAIAKTVCNDERFAYQQITRFDWWNKQPLVCDLFLATHFIEHLSFDHLQELIKAISAKHIYFEAPLTENGESWDGFFGTHKLEVGWQKVAEVLAVKGYKRIDITSHCKLYER